MPKAAVTILETNFDVEYDFKITAHGSPASYSSYGGDPAEPAEFEIEIIELRTPRQHADVHFEIPAWLDDLLCTHLSERDDVNNVVQQADHERGSYDPDDERI